MHTSLAIKINGYWAEKTSTGVQKGRLLEGVWCIYDTEGYTLTGDGFGQIPTDNIDEYFKNPDNYPTINGKSLYVKGEEYFEKRRIKNRSQVLKRLNIASDEKIESNAVIAWSAPSSLIPQNIITSMNENIHRLYLHKFKVKHQPLVCSLNDNGVPSNKAFIIKELIEIRYLHFSKKANKYFLITLDSTGNIKRSNGELSDTDASEEYIIAGIKVSGKVAVSEDHLSKYHWPDWKREKLLKEDHHINDIWLIFDNIKYDKRRLISDSTFLTPFSDYDVYKIDDNNNAYKMLSASNDKHDLLIQVLRLDKNERKEYCGPLTVDAKGKMVFDKLIGPEDSNYNNARNSFKADVGELIYMEPILVDNINKYEYNGFIINSIHEQQICHLRKSGKYKVLDINGNLIREGMYISKGERKDLKNHFLYLQDLYQIIGVDTNAR